jgi:hypothetical protein
VPHPDASHPSTPDRAANFAADFDAATGLPPEVAAYGRLRVVLRLGGYTHAEVSEIIGDSFDHAPADWRERFKRADAAVDDA